jgi:hypothetical protein
MFGPDNWIDAACRQRSVSRHSLVVVFPSVDAEEAVCYAGDRSGIDAAPHYETVGQAKLFERGAKACVTFTKQHFLLLLFSSLVYGQDAQPTDQETIRQLVLQGEGIAGEGEGA